MDNLIEEVAEYEKWIEFAKGSSFFGKFLRDMSKEELLGVIGYLHQDSETRIEQIKHDYQVLGMMERKNKVVGADKSFLHPVIALIIIFFLA